MGLFLLELGYGFRHLPLPLFRHLGVYGAFRRSLLLGRVRRPCRFARSGFFRLLSRLCFLLDGDLLLSTFLNFGFQEIAPSVCLYDEFLFG